MTWFKVDDSFYSHPKVMSIPRGAARLRAIGLWASLGTWCADQLTDGHVPKHMVTEHGGTRGDVANLLNSGLWTEVADGYQFHNWGDWQPTRSEVTDKRTAAAERMRRVRANKSEQPSSVRDSFANPGPARPDPSLQQAAKDAPPVDNRPPVDNSRNGKKRRRLPGDLQILKQRLDAAKLRVTWNVDDDQVAQISKLITIHGDRALIAEAERLHRPSDPARFVTAWLDAWEALALPGAGLHVVKAAPCPNSNHNGTVDHCIGCAADRLAEGMSLG